MTARQFAFLAVRLTAAYLALSAAQSLPLYFLTQAVIPPVDPNDMPNLLYGLLAWSILPLLASVLWMRADRVAGLLLRGLPDNSPNGTHHPWEASLLTLFGVLILVDLLPLLVQYAVAYVQWVNRPPGSVTFETFFGGSVAPAELASVACSLALALFLIFRAPSIWPWLDTQSQSFPKALKNLRELGVVKTDNADAPGS